jgi:hypothetical protein
MLYGVSAYVKTLPVVVIALGTVNPSSIEIGRDFSMRTGGLGPRFSWRAMGDEPTMNETLLATDAVAHLRR